MILFLLGVLIGLMAGAVIGLLLLVHWVVNGDIELTTTETTEEW